MQPVTFQILVVDDDADDRLLIDEAFKVLHFEAEVKKFINGAMLLHYLDNIEPDKFPSVIVLDNFLPGMDSPDIIRRLKARKELGNIPIVILSSGRSPAIEKELLSLGVTAWYEKGYSQEEMLQLAENLKTIAMETRRRTA